MDRDFALKTKRKSHPFSLFFFFSSSRVWSKRRLIAFFLFLLRGARLYPFLHFIIFIIIIIICVTPRLLQKGVSENFHFHVTL
jgi:hypothetical protein